MANEAFIRWDSIRREQLGVATALLFGLSSASLAFCGSLLTSEKVQFGGAGTTRFIIAVCWFILALVASVLVTLIRLHDARSTARVALGRARPEPVSRDEIQQLRDAAKTLGTWAWRLLYVQVVSFSLGAGFLIAALWHIFYTKLFP